ncbi:zinc-binding dehydrogenase, partial [Streptomyces sp. 7R007]
MGKRDVREGVGVWYRAFDLVSDAGGELIAVMLGRLRALLVEGVWEALPVQVWPLARAREALRVMSLARHTGKVVLRV